MDLAAAYQACARTTRHEARNFYYAFLSLPRSQRLAVYALYAFCRSSDDVVDSDASSDGKREGLRRLRERLAHAAEGTPVSSIDLALADTIDSFGVEPDDLADVLNGMELDVTLRRVETADELDRYCYLAASAVGLATLPILNEGIPPTDAMRDAAIDLGLGMQYVNILRDVAEDADRDRIYLPAEQLSAFAVTAESLTVGEMTDPIRALFAAHADRAGELLDRGRRLQPLLPRSGRRCTHLLGALYGRILDRIRAADYDVFSSRASLSMREKVSLLVRSFWRL